MQIKLIAEHYVSKHFASAIVNDDDSGLDDDDITALNAFLYPKYKGCYFHLVDDDDFNFKRCEITKLMSDCYFMEVYKNALD